MEKRKVYVEGEATMMVPIKVKFNLLVNADNDASITKAVNHYFKHLRYDKADIELLDTEFVDINGETDLNDLDLSGFLETLIVPTVKFAVANTK